MQPEILIRSLLIRMVLSFVIVKRDARVAGEPQVGVLAGLHPGGERVALLLQFPVAARVEGDPGGGSLAEPVLAPVTSQQAHAMAGGR
jgi:hypothetical protein